MVALPVDRHTDITVEAYLAFEDDAPVKHEYYKGEIIAMAGASFDHAQIAANISMRLNMQLLGRSNCSAVASDIRVRASEAVYFYPDVVAVCDPRFADESRRMLLNPALVVEVTSRSTGLYDRTTKLEAYKRLPSVQEVLIVDQHRVHVDQYTRMADGWRVREFSSPSDVLTLESLGCTLVVSEVYVAVSFAE